MKKATILISNDDGYFAQGIEALISAFCKNYNVIVVAPKTEQSGKGHSFTYQTPINYEKINREDGVEMYSVSGAPADCVKVALAHLLDKKPDYVISGINAGENVGIASFYSGTCAVAREAGFWRVPSVAFSVSSGQSPNILSYGKLCLDVFEKLRAGGFLNEAGKTIYNVNFPNTTIDEIKGVKIVRQSLAYYKDSYIMEDENDHGKIKLRANEDGMALIEPDVNNFDVVANLSGFTTITPVLLDATDERVLLELRERLG